MQSNLAKPIKVKRGNIPRTPSSIENDSQHAFHSYRSYFEGETVIPVLLRNRLHDLFMQIEKEFENLYAENLSCEYENLHVTLYDV